MNFLGDISCGDSTTQDSSVAPTVYRTESLGSSYGHLDTFFAASRQGIAPGAIIVFPMAAVLTGRCAGGSVSRASVVMLQQLKAQKLAFMRCKPFTLVDARDCP